MVKPFDTIFTPHNLKIVAGTPYSDKEKLNFLRVELRKTLRANGDGICPCVKNMDNNKSSNPIA